MAILTYLLATVDKTRISFDLRYIAGYDISLLILKMRNSAMYCNLHIPRMVSMEAYCVLAFMNSCLG